MAQPDPGSDAARRARRMKVAAALALAALLLAFSAVMSLRAPIGNWPNRIFGDAAWNELDPGSFYVAAAHDFTFGWPPVYLGHPGTPLNWMLEGVQHGLHALHAEGESYGAWTARNLPTVFFVSKMLMTVLHLVSFALLFAFARELLRDELAAWCATLAYATSLPAFYYLSRISVEPLMMICLFGAFVAVWRSEDLAARGDLGGARFFAAVAGVAAVTGAVTKFNFLAPLLGLLILEVALAPRLAGDRPQRLRERLRALLALTSGGVVTLWFWSNWILWGPFFAFWSAVPALWKPETRTWNLVPSLTADGLLPLAELVFVSVALIGWVDVVRRRAGRERVLFVSAYALFALALFVYRVRLDRSFLPFHYFLPATGILAVFFGHTTARMLRGLPRAVPMAAALAAWLLVIHGLAVYAVVDSRLRDAEAYAQVKPTYDWIARLGPAQRIGVRAESFEAPDFVTKLNVLHTILLPAGDGRTGSNLRREFEELFTPIPAERADALPDRLFVPALGAELYAVDDAGPRE